MMARTESYVLMNKRSAALVDEQVDALKFVFFHICCFSTLLKMIFQSYLWSLSRYVMNILALRSGSDGDNLRRNIVTTAYYL